MMNGLEIENEREDGCIVLTDHSSNDNGLLRTGCFLYYFSFAFYDYILYGICSSPVIYLSINSSGAIAAASGLV